MGAGGGGGGGGEGGGAVGGLAMLKNSWSILTQDLSQDLSSLRGARGGAGKWGIGAGAAESDSE